MDTILGYLLSFSDQIGHIVSWAKDHPDAAAFYALLLNLVIAKIPAVGGGYGKDVIDIVGKALSAAFARKGVNLK